MGGGPRTYPGGVSKWQWKRMQAKKARQLLKARLARERNIYEMRKRAELKAAVSELERPWEVVERAPNLLSVGADEQVKVLADRFQRPGGFDLWTERDGPQLFETVDELPSARFFPKGVVHSIKPYQRNGGLDELKEEKGQNLLDSESSYQKDSLELSGVNRQNGKRSNGKLRKNVNRNRFQDVGSNGSGRLESREAGFDREQRGKGPIGSGGLESGEAGFDRKQRGKGPIRRNVRGNGSLELRDSQSDDVYDIGFDRKQREKGPIRRNVRGNGSLGLRVSQSDDVYDIGFDRKQREKGPIRRNVQGNGLLGLRDSQSDDVFDMNLQEDGSYEF
ncbi:putative dead-box atp-dependent rna helicase 33 [Quercus suber]|uniref:Dead-box atp-dependent rna helicase 33 n=2 Tax=Quercus suber TaxID=58331 RepID=A0AAW0JPH6_QUESU